MLVVSEYLILRCHPRLYCSSDSHTSRRKCEGFSALGPLPSDSPVVSPDVFADDGAGGSNVKRGRTQHGRPAKCLGQSVLHNEWSKGTSLLIYLHCCHHSWFSVCQLMLRPGAFGFIASLCFSWIVQCAFWSDLPVVKSSVGIWSGCCASRAFTISG